MNNYITKSTVLSRDGWTEKAIALFAPIPDKEVPNPYSKKSSPMKLYVENRIKDIEDTPEFKAFVEKNISRRTGAKKAIKTKIEKLHQYVADLRIEVPILNRDELIDRACTHYNYHLEYRKACYEEWASRNWDESMEDYEPDFREATPQSDLYFLKRISLNYLRHQMTNYEKALTSMGGKPGKDEVYEKLKAKVNNAITEKYSWLANND